MPVSFVSSATTLGTGGVSLAITPPAGLNASRLDLVIAAAHADNVMDPMTIGTDGGAYTAIVPGTIIPGSTGDWGNIIVARKTGAATPGNTNVAWTGWYPNSWSLASRIALDGVDLASPIDAVSGALTTAVIDYATVDPVLTVPQITTVTAGAMVIAYVVAAQRGSEFSTPSGWTKIMEGSPWGGTYSISMAVYRKLMSSAGATGALAVTKTMSLATYGWAGGMVAFKPAPGGGGGGAVRAVRANFFGL